MRRRNAAMTGYAPGLLWQADRVELSGRLCGLCVFTPRTLPPVR